MPIVGIKVNRHCKLPEIVAARHPRGRVAYLLYGSKHEANQKGENEKDNKQLKECQPTTYREPSRLVVRLRNHTNTCGKSCMRDDTDSKATPQCLRSG
jgi:hypothetical protein